MIVAIMIGIAILAILFYFGICHFIERHLRAKGWHTGEDARPYIFGGNKAIQWVVALIMGMALGCGVHIVWQSQAYELGIMVMSLIFLFFIPFGIWRLVGIIKRKAN